MVNILIQKHLHAKAVSGIASLANRIDGELANEPYFALGTAG